MARERCPVCDNGFHARLPYCIDYKEKEHWIVKCTRCGLGRLSPMPSDEEISTFYENIDFFEEMYDTEGIVSSKSIDLSWKGAPSVPLRLVRRFSVGRKLLEIGSAGGAALITFERAGFDVTGVETNDQMAKRSRKYHSLTVHSGRFEDHDFSEETFDVIYSRHVIEHVARPMDFMYKIRQVLGKNGVVLLEFPTELNTPFSRLRQVIGQVLHSRSVPYHLYYFDGQSICYLLRRFGFRVLYLRLWSNLTAQFIREMMKQEKVRALSKLFKLTVNTIAAMVSREFAVTGTVVARRTS